MTLVILTCAIGVLVVALLMAAFRCKHAWEFVDKTEFPSKLEEATKRGVSVSSFWNSQVESLTTKWVVIVLRCPKCGEAKVLRESN